LGSDAELGGQDQRKIFMLSRDHIHKLDYNPLIYLMNPMIPNITSKTFGSNKGLGLGLESESEQNNIQQIHIDKYIEQITKLKGKNITWDNFIKITNKIGTDLKDKYSTNPIINKMSSSNLDSKIEFTESPENIRKKISKAFAIPSNPDNALFLFLFYVVFPSNKLKNISEFIIERDEKNGGRITYNCVDAIKQDYITDKLTPQDLKQGISTWLINFLEPIRIFFDSPDLKDLVSKAYSG
jgi:tyrosyl-tRNA synthetase